MTAGLMKEVQLRSLFLSGYIKVQPVLVCGKEQLL